jgi:hypothetical protein
LRANGSRECAPDDRLREAIQLLSLRGKMDCFASLAMTRRERALDSRASEIFRSELRHNNSPGKSAKPVQPRREKYSA